MIGRMITMVAGRSLARSLGGSAAGPAGALLGAALPTLARRLGPLGTAVAAFAAYKVAQKARAGRDAGDQVVEVSPSRRRPSW